MVFFHSYSVASRVFLFTWTTNLVPLKCHVRSSVINYHFDKRGLAPINSRETNCPHERKLSALGPAHIVVLVYNNPPKGRSDWSLRLLLPLLCRIVESAYSYGLRSQMRRYAILRSSLRPGAPLARRSWRYHHQYVASRCGYRAATQTDLGKYKLSSVPHKASSASCF